MLKASARGGGIGVGKVDYGAGPPAAVAAAAWRRLVPVGCGGPRPPRGGPGLWRRERSGGAPARARVLDPAPAPEADRGEPRAQPARRAQGAAHRGGGG